MTRKYFVDLAGLFERITVTDRTGRQVFIDDAVTVIVSRLKALAAGGNKAMLIGNGGSASIAGHIAIDFLKNAGVPAIVFNDASSLTCLSNDLGYEQVFQKPIEILARPDDALFAVSSSGKSRNILSAVLEAQEAGCFIVTLSGFSEDNPLRGLGDLNFFVPSRAYGEVEITHLALLHCVADSLMNHG